MPTAQLIVTQPGQKERRVEISKGLVSIGRKSDNTISLEGDTNVSKYHAVIELRPDGFWLSDLGSSNGTFVNDAPVKSERRLEDGDLICVGGVTTVAF
ncbi:MAG: FHA domain-containing protein, partial [Pyrinomonadaceae bacterium]